MLRSFWIVVSLMSYVFRRRSTEHKYDSELGVPKYKFFRQDRDKVACKSLGGGLMFYFGSQYDFKLKPEWCVSSRDLECQWVVMSLKDT